MGLHVVRLLSQVTGQYITMVGGSVRILLWETPVQSMVLHRCGVQQRRFHSLREREADPWHADRNLDLENVKCSWSRRNHVQVSLQLSVKGSTLQQGGFLTERGISCKG